MTAPEGFVLIDSTGLVRRSQGYGGRNVYRYEPTGQRVEVDLYRDAYDRQSRFRVSVWTEGGWQRIAHRDGEALALLPDYVERSDAVCSRALDKVEADLLSAAAAVLAPAEATA